MFAIMKQVVITFVAAALCLIAQDTQYQPDGSQIPGPGHSNANPDWIAELREWESARSNTYQTWLADLTRWRHEHLIRMGYDDSQYKRPELLWTQRNFIQPQMMAEERYFYDPVTAQYTVDRYLEDLNQRYGGIDSVLIWPVYPNIGIDNRNQWDLARDLPGGIPALRRMVEDFHRRGVRVFFPSMPWDTGTRDVGVPYWTATAQLMADIGADGVNGDTFDGIPRAYRTASDETGHPVVLEPEGSPRADEALMWNNQSWAYWKYPFAPMVSKLKWLEPRHMINVCDRWARDKTDNLQAAFFNGVGYESWENIWGIWNQITPRDAEALRRVARIERQFAGLLISRDWQPYTPTLQYGVFASRFPGEGQTLWTLVNRNEYDVAGEQIRNIAPRRCALLRFVERKRTDPAVSRRQNVAQLRHGATWLWRGPRSDAGCHTAGPRSYVSRDEAGRVRAAQQSFARVEGSSAAHGGDSRGEIIRRCSRRNGTYSGR